MYRRIEERGKTYVLVEESEFRELKRKARSRAKKAVGPAFPAPDADGNVAALPYLKASIGREIATRRTALGLTQTELAKAAGIWAETLCRLEAGNHSPTVRTVERIDKALQRAAKKA